MVLNERKELVLVGGKAVKERVARRQDLARSYWSVGAMYLFKTELLFGDSPTFYGDRVAPYIMAEQYVVDINEPSDWEKAEQALQKLRFDQNVK